MFLLDFSVFVVFVFSTELIIIINISLKEAKEDLLNVKTRLKNVDKKKKALENDLLDVQNQLKNINRGTRSPQRITITAFPW